MTYMTEIFKIIMLVLLIVCAVILFMATLKKIDAEKEDAREEEPEDGRERT